MYFVQSSIAHIRPLLQVRGRIVKHAHPDERLREQEFHLLTVPPCGRKMLQEEHDILELALP